VDDFQRIEGMLLVVSKVERDVRVNRDERTPQPGVAIDDLQSARHQLLAFDIESRLIRDGISRPASSRRICAAIRMLPTSSFHAPKYWQGLIWASTAPDKAANCNPPNSPQFEMRFARNSELNDSIAMKMKRRLFDPRRTPRY